MPTFPGFNANFDLQKYPPTIRSALRRVADTFYVTRSFDPVQVDNSKYFAALIRPTDDATVVLNTQRELMILFADYDTFEIRTLEAFKEFYELTDSARVDKSIRFLVSGDDTVDRAIRLYLEQHPEYPIIVPITFSGLERTQDPVISSVRHNYLVRDVFGFQSPLREEHFFFGRSKIVSGTIDLAKSGQHSSLFGLRKSGKTSTIYAIERRCRPTELQVVTFDCQDLAIHGRKYGELLVHIIDKVRSKLRLKAIEKPSVVEGPILAEWFSLIMDQTLNVSQSSLLLIFDEIENISPGTAASNHWRTGNDPVYFWQIIRSFAQSSRKRSLAICLVGTSPYILEESKINGIDNPAYLLAQKRFIPNLDFDETREMVSRLGFFMGLDFDASSVHEIHESYGGHPFFTRQVCSKIHQLTVGSRPRQVSARLVKQAQSDFAGQLESYLFDIVFNLKAYYPSEYALLRSLVRSERTEFEEYVNEAPELIDHLLGYGLVRLVNGVAEVAFQAVTKAVYQIDPDDNLISLEGRWAELCVRRNKIEQGIRTTLGVWVKTLRQHELEQILTKQISKKRFDALTDTSARTLFSNKTSPLYLTDLIAILGSDKVLPYLVERRSSLRGSLQAINGYRADAHAKDISEDDFKLAQSHFSSLEDEFGVD